MSVQPFERLAYQNRFVKELIQPLVGVDCFQERADLNADDNLIALRLTEAQFIQIYSSLLTGADICYPDESLQIVANFLRGLHCPPELVPHECVEYPPYASFIAYPLQNPFTSPNLIPEGYLVPPFGLVTAENQDDYPQNEIGDIVVPFGAITLDANWFEDVSEQLPTITLVVNGSGTVNVRLLNQAQGGIAIITLDNPPNLADIILGIVSGSDNIIDTNLDILSLPPETAVEHIFPVEIETEGIHTIYIVFFPIIDDSLIPLRFGGGFRGVELCGFSEVVEMGVTDVRLNIDTYLLEQQKNGVYEPVMGFDEFLAYTQAIQAKSNDAWQFAYDLMQTTYHYSEYEGADVGFTEDSPLKLYIDAGGEPFDPSALEAAIAAAQADADAAAAAAAAAQSDADSAIATNVTQAGQITAIEAINTAQGLNITNLQGRMTTAELDIDIAQADILDIAGWRELAELALAASAQFQADMPQPFGQSYDFANDGLPSNWAIVRGSLDTGGIESELISGNQEVRINQIDELGYNGQGNVYMMRISVQYTGSIGETIYAGIFGVTPPDTIQQYRVTGDEFSLYVFRFIGNDYLNFGWKVRALGDFPFVVRAVTVFGWGLPNPI